jgi:hypothetical protein
VLARRWLRRCRRDSALSPVLAPALLKPLLHGTCTVLYLRSSVPSFTCATSWPSRASTAPPSHQSSISVFWGSCPRVLPQTSRTSLVVVLPSNFCNTSIPSFSETNLLGGQCAGIRWRFQRSTSAHSIRDSMGLSVLRRCSACWIRSCSPSFQSHKIDHGTPSERRATNTILPTPLFVWV